MWSQGKGKIERHFEKSIFKRDSNEYLPVSFSPGRDDSIAMVKQRTGGRVFGSVVAVVFQITFRTEKHVNNVLLFFKNHSWYQNIKTIQKIQTAFNFNNFFLNFFFQKTGSTIVPNGYSRIGNQIIKLYGLLDLVARMWQDQVLLSL